MKKLTQKQQQFVSEYIKTLDPEISAKKAGFKVKNLRTYGEKLLSDANIIKAINYQLKKRINTLQVHKGYVVHKLLEIAEFSLEEEDIYDKNNVYTGKKKFRDASNGLKAIEYLCKYLGFNVKDDIRTDNSPKIITIKNLEDEKI